MERLMSRWMGLFLVLGLIGCGNAGVDGATEALIPAGSNAAFVSSTIPTAMFPGERLDVSVTMTNTGTNGAANTWTTTSPTFAFFRTGATTFGLNYDNLESITTTGNNTTFNFILTAPTTPGAYTFQGQMGIVGDLTRFGAVVSIAGINVSSATPRRWGCGFVSSSMPGTLSPGESRVITVAVQNTGTATWSPPSSFFLYSQDTPLGLWANTNRLQAATIAPGATATFLVPITAPSAAGSYNFRRQMFLSGTVGFFDTANCVNIPVTVGGAAPFDNSFVGNTLPATMAPDELRSVTVTVQNTGGSNWPNDGTFYLYSVNSPVTLYGTFSDPMSSATATGAQHTFTFNIRAPSGAGSYTQSWRMFIAGTGYFGPTLNVPLTVDAGATPALGASVNSQVIPSVMTAGEPSTFSITMQNTGSSTWVGPSGTGIYSTNTPAGLWTVTSQFLASGETVAPMGTRTFVLSVTAPAAAGTYASRWRMFQNGVGFFGAEAAFTPITVTLCGNGTVDAGETCDDDNLTAGDGCSAGCAPELITIDLATAGAADRTLLEANVNHQLATVAIGDVTNDGIVDVVVADATHVTPGMGSPRNAAGTVFGYTGGASFFTNGSTTVPASAAFRVFGASTNDRLGAATAGDVVVGDVTGDGIADLIVSATFGDGAAEGRIDAGEVYVLTGGSGLTGDIDLGATTAPAALRATFIGAAAGDRLNVLAVGDLTGDGTGDLVLGAPFADINGADSGAVYVIPGGAALTGTIDLSAPGITVFTILGETANSKLGLVAEVANFTGSATADLLLGNQHYTSAGLTRRGAAFGFVGPISANSVATPGTPAFSWLGATQNDNFGCALAIGNVLGTSATDVLIGAYQQRRAGTQVGAVNVWNGATLTPGTLDLASAGGQAVVFLGADAFDNAGSSLVLGDMNGDGFLDIPVASGLGDGPANARTSSGEVVVFFGASSLSGTIDLSLTAGRVVIYGAAGSDALGLHVPGIAFADIDADGRADLCVGSFQGGASQGGRVDCIQSTF